MARCFAIQFIPSVKKCQLFFFDVREWKEGDKMPSIQFPNIVQHVWTNFLVCKTLFRIRREYRTRFGIALRLQRAEKIAFSFPQRSGIEPLNKTTKRKCVCDTSKHDSDFVKPNLMQGPCPFYWCRRNPKWKFGMYCRWCLQRNDKRIHFQSLCFHSGRLTITISAFRAPTVANIHAPCASLLSSTTKL